MAQRKKLRVYIVNTVMPLAPVFMVKGVQTLYFDGATGHAQKFGFGTRLSMGIPYSAKFSCVSNFVNSEPLTKIFQ